MSQHKAGANETSKLYYVGDSLKELQIIVKSTSEDDNSQRYNLKITDFKSKYQAAKRGLVNKRQGLLEAHSRAVDEANHRSLMQMGTQTSDMVIETETYQGLLG